MNVVADNFFKAAPLHIACAQGRKYIAELLINHGAGVTVADELHRSPLHWACENGSEAVARLLLDNGAIIGAVDNLNWTPLHWAAQAADCEV